MSRNELELMIWQVQRHEMRGGVPRRNDQNLTCAYDVRETTQKSATYSSVIPKHELEGTFCGVAPSDREGRAGTGPTATHPSWCTIQMWR
jgi:hypothetical protein